MGRVSLYRVTYSAAGEGHVAFVDIPEQGCTGIYTDSLPLAEFITRTVARGGEQQQFL